MIHLFFRITAFALISFSIQAQTLTGQILDSKTAGALPLANVFVNNTDFGTVSDTNGYFTLKHIPPGSYDLVISFVGYETKKIKVIMRFADLILSPIVLRSSAVQLGAVEVKGTRDKVWERQLRKFAAQFLGEDKWAKSCQIVNPWVVNFPKDDTDNRFLAQADAPIEILNEALGYKIFYYLTAFWSKDNEYLITGNTRFEELEAAAESQALTWARNREQAYQQSYNFFFKMLLDKRSKAAGFQLAYPNANKESKKYGWQDWVPYDTIGITSNGDRTGEFKVNMKGEFEIYNNITHDRSRLQIKSENVLINDNGFVLNPEYVRVSGTYDGNRIASLLPISYQGARKNIVLDETERLALNKLYEKVYVQTDKPYYYPGEPMWFKGYINYREPAWRDSLSKVVYVELINPMKEITLTKTLKIDSGFFHNDFILPDTLKEGTYYLRVYTNLVRNFGDSNLFVKPIPILNIMDKVDHTQEKVELIENGLLVISSDKRTYNTREKITLTLRVGDKEGNPPAANLSLSVTDAVQVEPIDEPVTIMNGYSFEWSEHVEALGLKHRVEYGVGFTGRFLNDKGKPESTNLNIFQMKPRSMMLTSSDETGFFSVNGLDFYDTAMFSFKSDKAKDHPYGKVEPLPREIAPMNFKTREYDIVKQNTQSRQRILSEYEVPKDVRLLEGVEVKASRIEEQYQQDYRVKRPYGKPDYVLKGKDINTSYGNLLFAIQGKFPGLSVRETDAGWVVYTIRGALSSRFNSKEVLVMVNDVPSGGTPGQILSSINPETVESIEFTNRINVLYGSSSGFGVLSIYTKHGASDESLPVTPNFQTVKLTGYNSSREFKSPDYDDKNLEKSEADYRSTIYWNPSVITDKKTGTTTVSFFAADLPGKYRVVAEGVAQNGEPVRCVYFVEVD